LQAKRRKRRAKEVKKFFASKASQAPSERSLRKAAAIPATNSAEWRQPIFNS
jgi:hypothetical protein